MDDKVRDIIEGLKISLEVNRKLVESNTEIAQELIRQLQSNGAPPQQQQWRQPFRRTAFRGRFAFRGNYNTRRQPRAIQDITVSEANRNTPERHDETK